jgi:hypothetical protein
MSFWDTLFRRAPSQIPLARAVDAGSYTAGHSADSSEEFVVDQTSGGLAVHIVGNEVGAVGAIPLDYTTDDVSVVPSGGALTDRSGSIATGGVSQQVAAAQSTRAYLIFVNCSDTTMWINFGVDAVADQPSIPVVAMGSYVFEASFVSTQALHVICGSNAKSYTCKEFLHL